MPDDGEARFKIQTAWNVTKPFAHLRSVFFTDKLEDKRPELSATKAYDVLNFILVLVEPAPKNHMNYRGTQDTTSAL